MRHAHASWLLAGGADVQTVKERLGHASLRTTERYLHALPGRHEVALAALAAVRSPKGQDTPSPDLAATPIPSSDHDRELEELRSTVAALKAILTPPVAPT
jgi:hypothetical protein